MLLLYAALSAGRDRLRRASVGPEQLRSTWTCGGSAGSESHSSAVAASCAGGSDTLEAAKGCSRGLSRSRPSRTSSSGRLGVARPSQRCHVDGSASRSTPRGGGNWPYSSESCAQIEPSRAGTCRDEDEVPRKRTHSTGDGSRATCSPLVGTAASCAATCIAARASTRLLPVPLAPVTIRTLCELMFALAAGVSRRPPKAGRSAEKPASPALLDGRSGGCPTTDDGSSEQAGVVSSSHEAVSGSHTL